MSVLRLVAIDSFTFDSFTWVDMNFLPQTGYSLFRMPYQDTAVKLVSKDILSPDIGSLFFENNYKIIVHHDYKF